MCVHCERLLQTKIHAVAVEDVQCDEIWGFVWCKEKNNVEERAQRGDAYWLFRSCRETATEAV